MADRIVVIGIGPDGRPARPVPADATLVAGGRRHLDVHAPPGVATTALAGDLADALAALDDAPGTAVVLASGDPGWFGIVRRLTAAFGPRRVKVHPAVSSVAAAFAAVGLPWEDAVVVSGHGRDLRAAVAAGLAHPKVAVLTAPDAGPSDLARGLAAAGCGHRRVVVLTRLGHDDATVHDTDLAGAADLTAADPNVVLLLDPARAGETGTGEAPPSPQGAPTVVAHTPPARPWARPAAAYAHRDGQVSKPEVRALALAHLAPAPGRLLWDVGCGAGSVAVEAAGLGAGVVAIDRDADQLDRARANADRHGVGVGLVLGEGPAAFDPLPDPDAVFVGGGGPDLPKVLDEVARRCRDRVAVALATVERVGPVLSVLTRAGWDAAGQLVQVHDLAPLGDGHRLAPRNPVALVLATRLGTATTATTGTEHRRG